MSIKGDSLLSILLSPSTSTGSSWLPRTELALLMSFSLFLSAAEMLLVVLDATTSVKGEKEWSLTLTLCDLIVVKRVKAGVG